MEENGYSHNIPRSVNIYKSGKMDPDSLQEILESMKDALVSISEDEKDIKNELVQMKKKQDDMEIKMKPVISFYRKVLTIVAFCAAVYTAYKTGVIEWIKNHFF